MKKILITGVSGFVGSYLVEELQKNDINEIYGTRLKESPNDNSNIKMFNLDLTNSIEVNDVISMVKPDVIFHLAAQSSVKISWDDPVMTVNTNVIGTINLLEAIRKHCYMSRIVLIGSSEEYGNTFMNHESPSENSKCLPQNVYSITKLTQNYLGSLYANAYGMNIIMTRSFNHFGPRQNSNFVVADFCNQVAKIEYGLQDPVIKVGNLNAYRDFLDVRDIVSAYVLLSTNGITGKTYNVGSGKATRIGDLLEKIVNMSTKKIEILEDETKFRPIDIAKTVANISAISEDTNWSPLYSIDQTLTETLEYHRKLIRRLNN